MKKISFTFILIFTFAFILLGYLGFNTKEASAYYDAGCSSAGPYSTLTGMLCSNSSYYNTTTSVIPGCYSGNAYSVLTGQACFQSQYYNTQNTYPYNTYNQQTAYGNSGSCIPTILNGVLINSCGSSYNNGTYNYPYNPPINQYPYTPPPVVTTATSSVSGSQVLNIGQQGSWTVTVYNTYNSTLGNLTYSVNWGDQAYYGTAYPAAVLPQSSTTFSHAYSQAGTYTPVFTVTNIYGQVVSQTSLSVTVSGTGYYSNTAPVIYSIAPSGGSVGTLVTITGAGFGTNGYNNGYYTGCSAYSCSSNLINTINFGGSTIPSVYSNNGTTLTFTVPASLNNCQYSQYCTQTYTPVTHGYYAVSVTNANGTSNTFSFLVF